ncbi:GTP pyrophosphokinase [Saliphagus sp. GCM10025308]
MTRHLYNCTATELATHPVESLPHDRVAARIYLYGRGAGLIVHPLERAIEIAATAHADQTDKAGETYILHPLRVMFAQDSEAAMIAAVLHDVVEDSDWTVAELRNDDVDFPDEAIDAVELLMKSDDESYEKFVADAAPHPIARAVKRADIEDNMDLTRLDSVDTDTMNRIEKYHNSWKLLQAEENPQGET